MLLVVLSMPWRFHIHNLRCKSIIFSNALVIDNRRHILLTFLLPQHCLFSAEIEGEREGDGEDESRSAYDNCILGQDLSSHSLSLFHSRRKKLENNG